MKTPHSPPVGPPSPAALFRFQVVCRVLVREREGLVRAEAVRATADEDHLRVDGTVRRVSTRSVYRWLKTFEHKGFEGLVPAPHRARVVSRVLPAKLLDFLLAEKREDRRASIPELLRRARERGVLRPGGRVDRSTVWRALRRAGVETRHGRSCRLRDSRRFAFPHRMQMVLCDGKHFRAGAKRRKRVALFFLDDATRFGLHVVVGTSESTALFLRGLHGAICHHGMMSVMHLDHGPGFIAADTLEVAARLDVRVVHGQVAYPQARGKVERFNRTATADLLRGLDRRPDVDPGLGALELRLQHYLREIYNHAPHRSLGRETPAHRFRRDPRPLRHPESRAELRSRFVVHLERRATNDNVVSVDGLAYELPRGHAGQRVTLQRNVLDATVSLLHEGRLTKLHPVDLTHNARDSRARDEHDSKELTHPLPKSSADLVYERELAPIIDPDGGFSDAGASNLDRTER